MRKRERENPCFICGHYHKYEEGEPCGVCGHRLIAADERSSGGGAAQAHSAFSSEILPGFLFCGSYDNASRSELLKAQGISRILNTVPTCQNLYKNSFVYHTVQDSKVIPFEECNEFIEQCQRDQAKVLVHCMSGQSRSPAVVVGYLMRAKGVKLPEAVAWLKERRPSVNIQPAMLEQLQAFEARLFGGSAALNSSQPQPQQQQQQQQQQLFQQPAAASDHITPLSAPGQFPSNASSAPSSFPPLPNFPFPMPPLPLGPDANPAAGAGAPFAGLPPLAPAMPSLAHAPFPPGGGLPFAFPGMGPGAGGNPPEGFVFGAGPTGGGATGLGENGGGGQ
ncbi:hypothetical protein CLOM_g3506 [Closterium sp. NIES-68]|nr:hypothetical protein CLOM_g3506 [Closterium sp. NIES-68]GJP75239.1 hypothetical protein CLOP_g5697 [Closterium sp. NIES-67]